MSRSGFVEDAGECDDHWRHVMWCGAVKSSLRGARGQAFLKELVAALDAMPAKRLIAGELIEDREVCALGAVGLARGLDMEGLDPTEWDRMSTTFGISETMVREIEYQNDDGSRTSPAQRWEDMRAWAVGHIRS